MNDADLELCERAARTVGVKTRRWPQGLFVIDDPHGICPSSLTFDPLTNDRQAERVAEHIGLLAKRDQRQLARFGICYVEALEADLVPSVARRRAIVRVAAEVAP